MSEPEIARRCHACGASSRHHAAFCPQCGEELKTTAELNSSGPDKAGATTTVDTAPHQESPIPQQPQTNEKSVGSSGQQSEKSLSKTPLAQPKPTAEPEDRRTGTGKSSAGTHGSHLVAGARDKVQRATGIAKHVGGDVVQRGHKLREMSSVVLDEASYDPSLRFVLVAAALFLLFLVMVLLNRFIV